MTGVSDMCSALPCPCVRMMATLVHVMVVVMMALPMGQGREATSCLTTSETKVNLQCEASEKIHVIRKFYKNPSTCPGDPTPCEYTEDFPTITCNGVSQCQEEVTIFGINQTCGTRSAQATVQYECITGNPVNICDVTTLSRDNTLYLASPTYPRGSGNMKTNGTCVCDVTGTMMKVSILEVYFRGTGSKITGRLVVIGDTAAWTSDDRVPVVYNTLVINDTDNLKVAFNDFEQLSQDMWIKVSGSSNMTAICYHGDDNITVPTFTAPSSPAPTAVNTTPSHNNTDPDKTQLRQDFQRSIVVITVSAAIGAVLVVTVIIVVAVMVFRKEPISPGKQYVIEETNSNEEMKEVEDCDMPTFVMNTLM
ncbi:uncharacterized protein LOC124112370 isoform X2 [Haliotis rufescens]|uniref:uncharacterized protein LOC124112370 isoform X2 n=1 Tax=Haliotis rufescens TaxID=6454 RepID=UPI00201F913E|nr:uncharacterized protein LOC124112370 isoform X2 [Haliotis rufescens]